MIKILSFDVMVIDEDTHVSAWVEQHRSLRIAEDLLKPFRKYVGPETSIVDAGAMIGDHTITYSDWVSDGGQVFAFEPNPKAFECLMYNMRARPHVLCSDIGLSDEKSTVGLSLSPNVGASHLSERSGDLIEVTVAPLDNFCLPEISFMKLDVEGFETRLLRGARKTIEKYHPVMLIEVNHGALERAGTSAVELFDEVASLGYQWSIVQKKADLMSPLFDILCIHKSSPYATL